MRLMILATGLMLAGCGGSSGDATTNVAANGASVINAASPQMGEPGTPDGNGMRWQLSGFDGVTTRGPDDVAVTVGPQFSIRATGDAADLQALRLWVEDGTLIVSRESGSRVGNDATVAVTMPAISRAGIVGAGDVSVDRVSGERLLLAISGAGDIDVGTVEVGTLEVNISGAGDVEVDRGTADAVNVTVMGAGDFDGDGVRARRSQVSLMGAGDASLNVSESANLTTMGAGNIRLTGGAQCAISRAGAGTVTCN